MAHIIRPLTSSESWQYMPLLEMNDDVQKEIYEAAGERLCESYDLYGKVSPGIFLVALADKREVAFPYRVTQGPVRLVKD